MDHCSRRKAGSDESEWSWEPHILRACSELDAIGRLEALDELIWRREMLLDPISPETEQIAEEAISAIDCDARTVDGADHSRI